MAGPWLVVALAMSVGAAEDEAGGADAPAADEDDAAAATAGVAVPVVAPVPVLDVRLAAAPAGRRLSESAPVLLDRFERPDGVAVERLVESSGEVVVHEVNRVGTVLSCRSVGKLQTLRVVEQREAAGGEVVHVARDDSGAVVRYVVDAEGEARAVAIVTPAPR